MIRRRREDVAIVMGEGGGIVKNERKFDDSNLEEGVCVV